MNAGLLHNLMIANTASENVAKLRYLGTTLTNQNCKIEDIKSRTDSGNVCYRSVQHIMPSHLLCKNITIKICETTTTTVITPSRNTQRVVLDNGRQTFTWQRDTPVILGCSVGCMWKNNNEWYTEPSKLGVLCNFHSIYCPRQIT